jgi:glycosyltransferase involved in cell wall biosynthesis
MTRLTVVQPYVPLYRSEFYRRSTDSLADSGVEMVVTVGRRDSARADGDTSLSVIERPDRLEMRTQGRLRYRSLSGLGRPGDLLLLEQAIKNLDGYPALVRQHLSGPSVGFWGHGRSYSSPQSAVPAAVKQWMTRRGQWFFAYTPSGASDVISRGYPSEQVSVLNNTLDTDSARRALNSLSDSDVAAWARTNQLVPDRTALFIGGLDAKKSTAYVLAVARQAHALDPQFTMLMAGGGPDTTALRAAQDQGAPIRVLGRVDGIEKAMALRASQVLAIPSQLGLVVIDSFVSGRPIITRADQWHGPEAEYLDPGRDSLWLDRSVPAAEYAKALTDLLDSPDRLESMQAACRKRAETYTMSRMSSAFVDGVMRWRESVSAATRRAR